MQHACPDNSLRITGQSSWPRPTDSGSMQTHNRSEACTKQHFTCSRGPAPCARCAKLGIQCVFRSQRPRGPHTRSKPASSDKLQALEEQEVEEKKRDVAEEELLSCLFTLTERRCWRVFFSALHSITNTRKRDDCTIDGHLLFWLGQTLHELHVLRARSTETPFACALGSWLDSASVLRLSTIVEEEFANCLYPPHLCGWCTDQISTELAPMPMPAVKVSDIFDFERDKYTKPALKYVARVDLKEHQEQFTEASSGIQAYWPFLRSERVSIIANELFEAYFGYSSASLKALAEKWPTNASMLPWGLDILAVLLHYDTEIFLLIQTLALKLRTAVPTHVGGQGGNGLPVHMSREVITFHICDMELADGKSIGQFVMRALYKEVVTSDSTTMSARMTFEPVVASSSAHSEPPARASPRTGCCDPPAQKRVALETRRAQVKTPAPCSHNGAGCETPKALALGSSEIPHGTKTTSALGGVGGAGDSDEGESTNLEAMDIIEHPL